VRRCWRFGQKRPVTVDIVLAESESALQSAVANKESDHRLMQAEMANAMKSATMKEIGLDKGKAVYEVGESINLPSFLGEVTCK